MAKHHNAGRQLGLFPEPERGPKTFVPVRGRSAHRNDALAGWLCAWEHQQDERLDDLQQQQEQRLKGDRDDNAKENRPTG
jgi:hypothetical protein